MKVIFSNLLNEVLETFSRLGGNQRELSRVKAEKRKEKYAKSGSTDFEKRKER